MAKKREIHLSTRLFINWIAKRIKANKNAIIIVNGPTGSGKTYACISMAQAVADKLGTNFSVKNNLAFKFPDLLQKMKLEDNQLPGTAFVFEEVGAFGGGASSREWQSQANKFFFSFMQTSRHRNQIIFMNCPDFSYLESGARKLVHFQFQMAGIDRVRWQSFIKPYKVQVNSRSGKFYFKYMRITTKDGTSKLNRLVINYPGSKPVKDYEKVKLEFTSSLNEEMLGGKEANKKEIEVVECLDCKHQWKQRGLRPGRCPLCSKFNSHKVKVSLST